MQKVFDPPKSDYVLEGNHIVSLGDIRGHVSGTMVAGILGISPWYTPFQVACNLLGLCTEDIGNKPAVKMGHALEGRIIDYLGQCYSSYGDFVSAEDYGFAERTGDHDSWEPDFKDKMFTGHVDGIVISDDGEYILEIKTSANLDSWKDVVVPEYYYWQIALYNEFITKQDKAYVALGMVSQDDYGHPEDWVAGDDTVTLREVPLDREQIQNGLEEVRSWYLKYIRNGITPDYDPNNPGDVEMYNHLVNLASSEEDIQTLIDQYFQYDTEVKDAERTFKDKTVMRDTLKNKIKTYMDCHDMTEMMSATGVCKAGLSESVSVTYDHERMVEDGIDLTPYTVSVVQKRFTVKKCKKE